MMPDKIICDKLSIEVGGPAGPWVLIKADGVPIPHISKVVFEVDSSDDKYTLHIEQKNEPMEIVIKDAVAIKEPGSEVDK